MAAPLEHLLEEARTLDGIGQRKVAALLGACVADAAARPTHWVYDVAALEAALRQGTGDGVDRWAAPEFFPVNLSPFYSIPTGANSCYFDIVHAVLAHLERSDLAYALDGVCTSLYDRFFGPATEYSLAQRKDAMAQARDTSADTPTAVLEGKWLHGTLVHFHDRYVAGGASAARHGAADIKETDGFCASLPLAVLHAGGDSAVLQARLREVSQTQTRWSVTVDHGLAAARLVEALVLEPAGAEDGDGGFAAVMDAVREDCEADDAADVAASMTYVEALSDVPHEVAVGRLGRPCYNPGSFQGAVHAVLTSSDFATAVRRTIRAGGCCCSRAVLIGALAGARYGLDGLPMAWLSKAHAAPSVLQSALAAARMGGA
eukprot:TRINITY_DN7994_c0_g1_i2.p1 TRINITY_DN7994_c0_g1~~TRINITY_DN7994_c0_g1_i2.p1  ORF type:complete len:437 (+),score=88.74 TRINITY_DN7994_c0_g1_i2:189-1313(+)